jgi:hypothetical protein
VWSEEHGTDEEEVVLLGLLELDLLELLEALGLELLLVLSLEELEQALSET